MNSDLTSIPLEIAAPRPGKFNTPPGWRIGLFQSVSDGVADFADLLHLAFRFQFV